MELVKILNTQTARLIEFSTPSNQNVRVARLCRYVEDRYSFLQGPQVLSDYDITSGITFLHGFFNSNLVIDKFQIFDQGVLAEGKINSNDLDRFIENTINGVKEQFDISTEFMTTERIFKSIVEVKCTKEIGKKLDRFNELNNILSNILESYGKTRTKYELYGVMLYNEVQPEGTIRPGQFRFERRDGVLHSSGLYYSEAPLKTDDHLSFLHELEKIL